MSLSKKILLSIICFTNLYSHSQIVEKGILVDSFINELITSNNSTTNDIKYKKISNNALIIVRNFKFRQINSNMHNNVLFDSVSISKYTLSGQKRWEKRYLLPDGGRINDFIESADHELLLVGDIGTNNVFVKLDSSGNIVLTKSYPNQDSLMSLKTIIDDKQGHFLVYSNKIKNIGQVNCPLLSFTLLNSKKDYLTQITSNGDVNWSKLINDRTVSNYYLVNPIIEINPNNNNINYVDYFTDQRIPERTKIKYLQFDVNGTQIKEKALVDSIINDSCREHLSIFVSTSRGYSIFVDHLHFQNEGYGLSNVLQHQYTKDGIFLDTLRPISKPFNTDNSYPMFLTSINNVDNFNRFIDVESADNRYANLMINPFSRPNLNIYILFKSDKDFNIKWNALLEDNQINDYEMPFITSINDTTLLLASIIFKTGFSESIAYLKFYTISTKANQLVYDIYIDRNENGRHDAEDSVFSDGVILLNDSSLSNYTSLLGNYVFVETGTYVSRLSNYDQRLKYYFVSPDSVVSIFNSLGNIDTIPFRLVPKPNIQDLQVSIVATAPPRPGFNSQYKIIASNMGTKTIEHVTLKFLSDTMQTYVQASTTPNLVTDDTLVWQLDSLTRFETREFIVEVSNQMPPVLQAGDTLHQFAAILPFENDSFLPDNQYFLRQLVVNSIDPNDKAEAHAGGITTQELNQRDFLYYTIRFQNTGTAAANVVTIKDTLSTALDWNTFEMLSASHSYQLSVTGKRYITWNFSNIYLPDSTSDEPGSHGYIHFRIKPAAGLTPDDLITNRAAVYFDYNPPVITNTVSTQILQPRITAVALNSIKSINVYPNPTNDLLMINAEALQNGKYTLQILDVNGQTVRSEHLNWTIGKQTNSISLQGLPEGLYLLSISNPQQKTLYTSKILKQ